MSLLVILMCFRAMTECTILNAPMVLRKELTTGECEREVERIMGEAKAGYLANPHRGYYAMKCEPLEPKA